ncbi:hypothetical protein [Xanthomonas phage X1]|nr:hypothetical protein [Xanthomonas phage X1]
MKLGDLLNDNQLLDLVRHIRVVHDETNVPKNKLARELKQVLSEFEFEPKVING